MSCGLELWLCQDFPTPVASGHPNWISIVNRGHEHFHSTKVREILLWLLFYCYTTCRGNLLVMGFVWPHKLVPLKPAKLPRCTQSTQASHYFPKDSAISIVPHNNITRGPWTATPALIKVQEKSAHTFYYEIIFTTCAICRTRTVPVPKAQCVCTVLLFLVQKALFLPPL